MELLHAYLYEIQVVTTYAPVANWLEDLRAFLLNPLFLAVAVPVVVIAGVGITVLMRKGSGSGK